MRERDVLFYCNSTAKL